MASVVPAVTSQFPLVSFGAGCVATMGIQSMYTWLSPTGQAQHIKKILNETRVFMTQLKEKVPSGMVGEASNWTTIAVLEERVSEYVMSICKVWSRLIMYVTSQL